MKFATQSRVTVPGTTAQGVIVDATETVTGFPIYTIRWLDEAGETHTGTCGEGDLAKANPSEADIYAATQDRLARAALIESKVASGVASRIALIVRNKRSAARRKSVSKRKR